MDRVGEMMLPFKMTGTKVRPEEMVLLQTGFPSMELEPSQTPALLRNQLACPPGPWPRGQALASSAYRSVQRAG